MVGGLSFWAGHASTHNLPLPASLTAPGIDIRSLSLRWLRSVVAMVGQEPVLFSGTIRDNVRWA